MACSMRARQSCSDGADTRFAKVEEQIHEALRRALRDRCVELRPTRICKTAKITRPTFYAHCDNSTDALRKYELILQGVFLERLPKTKCGRDVVYTILLGFIYDKQDYFAATIPNDDYWLLNTLLQKVRSLLVTGKATDRAYGFYARTQTVIISDWAVYDYFSKQRIPFYVQKLMRTRLVDPAA